MRREVQLMNRAFALVLFMSLFSCNQKVGGPCSYEQNSYTMGVTELIKSNDSLQFVVLAAGDAASVKQFKFSAEELAKFDLDFEQISRDRKELQVTLEEITKGTCTPYHLVDIKQE
ncbi:hypothetical protein [Aureitalea marina]|uniref:Uncharacterized protein n=1 Tax=Aureitalea marina TaxID=930804 RepID=A0A2S7KRQ8_9FLAO|nr:hypothetical protein [Aureitalea marina]PQB05287.1 hypothetical protein BST85_10635 [Aureitalea marina]